MHHQFVAGQCHQRRVAAGLSRHVGHGPHPGGIESGQPVGQHEALLGRAAGRVHPQAEEGNAVGDGAFDLLPRPRHGIAGDGPREHDLRPFPAALQRGIDGEQTFLDAQPPRQFGRRSRQQTHEAQFAGPAAGECQRHGPEFLDVEHHGLLPHRLHLPGGNELIPVIGGDASHGGCRIDERDRYRGRHRSPPRRDLQIGCPHRVVDLRLVGIGRPQHGIGRHHDLLAGQRHEHGMPGGAGGKKRHRFDARESAVAETPRQFQRPAEITAAVVVFGRIEPQHQHAAFVAALEPVELPQDGRLHLGVAGAGDRQPDRHRSSLRRTGLPGGEEGR